MFYNLYLIQMCIVSLIPIPNVWNKAKSQGLKMLCSDFLFVLTCCNQEEDSKIIKVMVQLLY